MPKSPKYLAETSFAKWPLELQLERPELEAGDTQVSQAERSGRPGKPQRGNQGAKNLV